MRTRLIAAFVACVLTTTLTPARAASEYRVFEFWAGGGAASSFENSIFNVPNDIESSPEIFSFLYYTNLSPRAAVGFHIYGGTETTPEVALLPPGGGVQMVEFDISNLSLGVRGRYTIVRATLAPYVLAGFSWVDGNAKSGATGELSFGGISGCVGAGVAVGRRFLFSVEGLGSFGTADWKQPPFSNSNGKEFNPSMVGVFASFGFAWGRRSQ